MGFHLRILPILLVTTMALSQGVNPCGRCDPDVPSRPTPRDFVRRKKAASRTCGAGLFLNTTGQCQECPPGSFMTKNMATVGWHKYCEKCHVADTYQFQVEIEPCSTSRDTHVLCTPDHYRKRIKDPMLPGVFCNCDFECTACSLCGIGEKLYQPIKVESCYNYTDTVCCHADMVVSNGECVNGTTTTPTTRGTTQQERRGDTVETPSTSEPTTTHHINDFRVMLANPLLVFISLFLNFSS